MITIAAIRHSAIEGHTVIMSQTDDIHESFYDLFNQPFHRIDDYQCFDTTKIHQDFQCIVLIKESDLSKLHSSFLNNFEKYCISHKNLLDLALEAFPPWLKLIVDSTCKKVSQLLIYV